MVFKMFKIGDLIIAKRGCCYFIYPSQAMLDADDLDEKGNLDRMNNGELVFNRCYSTRHYGYARRLYQVKEYARKVQGITEV